MVSDPEDSDNENYCHDDMESSDVDSDETLPPIQRSLKHFEEDFTKIENVVNAVTSVRFGKRFFSQTALKCIRQTRFIIYNNIAINDILCDDNGAYAKSSVVKRFYVLSKNDNLARVDLRECRLIQGSYLVKIRERCGMGKYSWNDVEVPIQSVVSISRNYRRCVSFELIRNVYTFAACSPDSIWNNLNEFVCVYYRKESSAVLHSTAIDNGLPVVEFADYVPSLSDDENLLPHGNAKNSNANSYYRRTSDVRNSIRNKLETGKNSHTVLNELLTESDILGNTPCYSTPANLQQVHHISRQIRTESGISRPNDADDQIADITQMLKETMLWSSILLPDHYMLILSNNFIFRAMCHSCVMGNEVLGIDTTFNTTDLWLTDTVFKCRLIIRTSDMQHPYFLGPSMFHFRKTQQAFRRFAAELALEDDVENIHFIGTDLDSALYNGFLSVFKSASNLVCVWHLKKRDKAKLKELNANATACTVILKDIYGATIHTVKFDGLVDCHDADEFDSKLHAYKCTWDSLLPTFYSWFIGNRAELFKNCVIVSARPAGASLYYQGAIESVHKLEKLKQNFERRLLRNAVTTVNDIYTAQFNNLVLAVQTGVALHLRPKSRNMKCLYFAGIRFRQKRRKNTYLTYLLRSPICRRCTRSH